MPLVVALARTIFETASGVHGLAFLIGAACFILHASLLSPATPRPKKGVDDENGVDGDQEESRRPSSTPLPWRHFGAMALLLAVAVVLEWDTVTERPPAQRSKESASFCPGAGPSEDLLEPLRMPTPPPVAAVDDTLTNATAVTKDGAEADTAVFAHHPQVDSGLLEAADFLSGRDVNGAAKALADAADNLALDNTTASPRSALVMGILELAERFPQQKTEFLLKVYKSSTDIRVLVDLGLSDSEAEDMLTRERLRRVASLLAMGEKDTNLTASSHTATNLLELFAQARELSSEKEASFADTLPRTALHLCTGLSKSQDPTELQAQLECHAELIAQHRTAEEYEEGIMVLKSGRLLFRGLLTEESGGLFFDRTRWPVELKAETLKEWARLAVQGLLWRLATHIKLAEQELTGATEASGATTTPSGETAAPPNSGPTSGGEPPQVSSTPSEAAGPETSGSHSGEKDKQFLRNLGTWRSMDETGTLFVEALAFGDLFLEAVENASTEEAAQMAEDATLLRADLLSARMALVGLMRRLRRAANERPELFPGGGSPEYARKLKSSCLGAALRKSERIAVRDLEEQAHAGIWEANFAIGEYWSERSVDEGGSLTFPLWEPEGWLSSIKTAILPLGSEGDGWVRPTAPIHEATGEVDKEASEAESGPKLVLDAYVPATMAKAESYIMAGAGAAPPSLKGEKFAVLALRLYHHAKHLARHNQDRASEQRYREAAKVARHWRRKKLAAHSLARLGHFLNTRGRTSEAQLVLMEAEEELNQPNALSVFLHGVVLRKSAPRDMAVLEAADKRIRSAGRLPSAELEEQRAELISASDWWRAAEQANSLTHCLTTGDAASMVICLFCKMLYGSSTPDHTGVDAQDASGHVDELAELRRERKIDSSGGKRTPGRKDKKRRSRKETKKPQTNDQANSAEQTGKTSPTGTKMMNKPGGVVEV